VDRWLIWFRRKMLADMACVYPSPDALNQFTRDPKHERDDE
jgi:hypothetical protein